MGQLWTCRTRLEAVPVVRTIAVLTLAVVAAGGSVIAAEPATVPVARVRVTASQGRLVGRFLDLKGETIVLQRQKGDGAETVTIDRQDVVGLEDSERRSRRGKGAKVGALAGLAAAIAIGVFGARAVGGRVDEGLPVRKPALDVEPDRAR